MQEEKPNPTQSNQSADKLLTVLETMSDLEEPIHLKDLSKRLSMNASTVSRFLAPLQRRGYVEQEADAGRYYMTFKLCGLAANIRSHMDIRNLARPFMRNVAHIFKESSNLVIEEDMSALYIETVRGMSQTIMVMQRIGHIAPLHCTGAGKLFLAGYDVRALDKYIALKGLTAFTETTITKRDDLERELEAIRNRGYAFDNQECEMGSRCVAAPIFSSISARDWCRASLTAISTRS